MTAAVVDLTTPVVVRRPVFRLVMAGRDVTRELSPYVLSVAYTDHVRGKSDELEVEVEDRDGRWRGAWFPAKGTQLSAWIGYVGSPLVPCGTFEIDEVEAAGPPSTTKIKALAAGVSRALRTRHSSAHEGVSLRDFATTIATRLDLALVGDIDDVAIGRVTQHRETDLAFLWRVAEKWGHAFSVRDGQLIFYRFEQLEAGDAVATINYRGSEVQRYELRDTAIGAAYASAHVRYRLPETGELLSADATLDGPVSSLGDTLTLDGERVESAAQAIARAKVALRHANRRATVGRLTLTGTPRLVAGTTLSLGDDWGTAYAGKYLVDTSKHSISSRDDGYTTETEIHRAGFAVPNATASTSGGHA